MVTIWICLFNVSKKVLAEFYAALGKINSHGKETIQFLNRLKPSASVWDESFNSIF